MPPYEKSLNTLSHDDSYPKKIWFFNRKVNIIDQMTSIIYFIESIESNFDSFACESLLQFFRNFRTRLEWITVKKYSGYRDVGSTGRYLHFADSSCTFPTSLNKIWTTNILPRNLEVTFAGHCWHSMDLLRNLKNLGLGPEHSLNHQVWCKKTCSWLTGQDRNVTQSAIPLVSFGESPIPAVRVPRPPAD